MPWFGEEVLSTVIGTEAALAAKVDICNLSGRQELFSKFWSSKGETTSLKSLLCVGVLDPSTRK